MITKLEKDYSEILQLASIATTANGVEVNVIKLEKDKSNKAVLFTGMHHGREPASFLMNLYILLYLLKGHTNGDTAIKELLSNVNIYFIPILNVDGYIENNKIYDTYKDLNMAMVRKNRRGGSEFQICNGGNDGVGVDLNRNYGYMFGSDNLGSSDKPCQDDYRGLSPFSEVETQGIKAFIESHENIKIAFNYHAWGNLFIMPFNYLSEDDPILAKNFTEQFRIYAEFVEEAGLPAGNKAGNGKNTIGYAANGEASDWMLGERGIVSFSPELGVDDSITSSFYPEINLLVNNVLKANLNPALYGIQRASYFLKLQTQKKIFTDCKTVHDLSRKILGKTPEEMDAVSYCLSFYKQFHSNIVLKNSGFGEHKGPVNFKLYMSNITEIAMVSINRNKTKIYHRTVFMSLSKQENNMIVLPVLNDINDEVEISIKFYLTIANINITAPNTTLHYLTTSVGPSKLVFNNPKHSLKLSDFEEFTITETPKKPEEEKTSYRIIIGIAIGLILAVVAFFIIHAWRRKRLTMLADEEPSASYRHQLPQDDKVMIH
jgi:hypothetical protein